MHIITVIPLTRSKGIDRLSYFTAQEIPVGAIVTVPIRSKAVHAIVTESRKAEDIRAEIKDAPYELKKLGKVKTVNFFPPYFVEACRRLAEYYATGMGQIIDTLVPDIILENAHKITPPSAHVQGPTDVDETYAVQGDDDDRLGSWRSLIRQEFARKRSLVMYVPTIEDAKHMTQALTKGIEGYIFTLHTKLAKKEITETWAAIAETKHPIFIVATGSFCLLPRTDIDSVIIERENSRGWIGQKHPYMDIRHALETIARSDTRAVYRADSMLRVETLHRLDRQEIAQGSPFKWRSITLAHDRLVNMKIKSIAVTDSGFPANSETDQPTETTEPAKFRVLSPELEELIGRNHDESTHMFILTTRRGLSPITICSDCQTIVSCKNCSSPVVLHTSKETGRNFFMCHQCGERRSAHEKCSTCTSWRLAPLGIGIDRVAEEIREKYPDIDIFKIDADSTKTDTQIAATLEKFRNKPGSILLGTEMALVHLTEKVDHIAIASLDSLLALPDFRIQEKIMYVLIRLRSMATRSILVQTRRAEEKVFEYGLKGNLSDFYRTTLDERKRFSYPPFATLIKITSEGKKDVIAQRMADVQSVLSPREVDVFPAFTATVRGNSIIHGLLRLQRGEWPNTDLVARLHGLSQDIKVKVDPESLL
jgi:primosomal protein N'